MAEAEHVRVLSKGIEEWNAWRKQAPSGQPQLAGANLRGWNLARAELSDARLHAADLSGANLDDSLLSGADLREARLVKASLRRADLELADLIKANLTSADLTQARLRSADLSGAYLRDADFTSADLIGVGFAWTSFAGTRLPRDMLEMVRHYGRSYLDPRTVQLSDPVPAAFLQGCGWPQWLIEAWLRRPSAGDPFASCFISYASADESFALTLHGDLQAAGVRCWLAAKDMRAGAHVRDVIENEIAWHERVLLILSSSSLTSGWVEDEAEAAYQREREEGSILLVPIRLDDAVLTSARGWAAKLRRVRHIGDFTDWHNPKSYARALATLVRDLGKP